MKNQNAKPINTTTVVTHPTRNISITKKSIILAPQSSAKLVAQARRFALGQRQVQELGLTQLWRCPRVVRIGYSRMLSHQSVALSPQVAHTDSRKWWLFAQWHFHLAVTMLKRFS
jgi:hypothetical protein